MDNRIVKFRAWTGKEMVNIVDLTMYEGGGYKINDEVLSHYDKWPVMEFTGLKDKNDQEIYEDDIVRLQNRIGAVEYREDFAGFKVGDEFGTRELNQYYSDLEIIGNIYENPELLLDNK